ncbi:hypothetical protein AA906_16310, partial [Geobacillus stearothermophilus]
RFVPNTNRPIVWSFYASSLLIALRFSIKYIASRGYIFSIYANLFYIWTSFFAVLLFFYFEGDECFLFFYR